MSQVLIQQYLNQLQDLRKVSGTSRESVVREAFKDLLKGWARSRDLIFVPEYEIASPAKDRRYVDGALVHTLRVPFGYWEAKDEKDDLDAEIEFKKRRGYPQDNIIFEDSTKAVLVQEKQEVYRCAVDDVKDLEKLLNLFFDYERAEITEFRKAVEQFKTDLPKVLEALRSMIERAHKREPEFRKAAEDFLKHAQEAINPSLTEADVREMLIQHILTEDVFTAVFPGTPFHRDNNVARELYKLEATFFKGDTKYQTLKGMEPYYAAIRSAAAQIGTHHEKQTFLKVIYENFYKVYNPKAADRLGVIYTPNEIVRFMIESADYLCEKHFGRNLIDKDVEILDPAAGTGTFDCELLEHFRGQPAKLKHKYLEELHANEVAILPYYVANLNIEATYAAITGEYLEYPNLCFVDTLDNTYALRKYRGHTDDLFGSVSDDNVRRIRRQNSRKISVIIGNPPYNANQLNENENNKNREYPEIDKRIKETYIEESTAQKTKLYDMYARFFRWAADRLDENGILAFITNRSFIETRTFDGFRKVAAAEFNEIRIVDLGGDVRANPKLSGTKHNVFGIQTGVAISFMVRRAKQKGCRIFYSRRPEFETAEEKLAWLGDGKLGDIKWDEIRPDKKQNWINQPDNDFDDLLPIATREGKRIKNQSQARALFALFASGIKTNRDDWVYDFAEDSLRKKVRFFHDKLKSIASKNTTGPLAEDVKWSRDLKLKVRRGVSGVPADGQIVETLWRPFVRKSYWANKTLSDILTEYHFRIFGPRLDKRNPTIAFLCVYSSQPIAVMLSTGPFDYCLLKTGNGGTESVPFFSYYSDGTKRCNITDWGLERFVQHYERRFPRLSPLRGRGKREASEGVKSITKETIFQYVYGVLHDPIYREKYEIVNLGHGPLALYPGTRICQFIFEKCDGSARYRGRFAKQVKP